MRTILARAMEQRDALRAGNNRGFTLVELLVVVVIIVAIAAVAVPMLLNQREKAVEGVLESDAREVEGLLLNALSLEDAVTYSGNTVSSGDRSLTLGADGAVVTGSFPSGSVPDGNACLTITVAAESLTRTVCVPGATGGSGGFSISYPSSTFTFGSNNQTLAPNVSGADGPVTYTLDGTLPDGFSFNPSTGIITGPNASGWAFPSTSAEALSGGGYSSAWVYLGGAAPDGGVVVGGNLYGEVQLGVHPLEQSGDNDFFYAKVDTDGEWQWAVSTSLGAWGAPRHVSLADGSTILVASFQNVDSGSFAGVPLNVDENLSYVIAASISPSGDLEWLELTATGSEFLSIYSAVQDESGNVYVHGNSMGTTTLGAASIVEGEFVARLSSEGEWNWARSVEPVAPLSGSTFEMHPVDSGVILSGTFGGSLAFGSTTVESDNGQSVVVARLSSSGVWEWVTSSVGTDEVWSYSAWDVDRHSAVASDGSVTMVGGFQGEATFGTHTVTSVGNSDFFAARVSPTGVWQWAISGGGSGHEYAASMVPLTNGNFAAGLTTDGDVTFGDESLQISGTSEVLVGFDNNGEWLWLVEGAPNAGLSWGNSYIAPLPGGRVAYTTDAPGPPGFAAEPQFEWDEEYEEWVELDPPNELTFVGAIGANGNWDWHHWMTATTQDGQGYPLAAFMTSNGNLAVASYIVGSQISIAGTSPSNFPVSNWDLEHTFITQFTPTGQVMGTSNTGFPIHVSVTATDSNGSTSTSLTITME